MQPGHHLVEVVEAVGVHGLGHVARRRQRAQVEAGHHAEEARPGAAGGPEQVGVLLGVGADQLALGGHHVDGHDVLRRPAPAAGVPALAALQQEAADPDGRAVAAREEPAVAVEERPELGAAAGGRAGRDDLRLRVVRHLAQGIEVEHERVLAHRPLRPAVPAGAYGDLPAALAGQADPQDDVPLVGRAEHGGGLPVGEPAVEDPVHAGGLEAVVVAQPEGAGEGGQGGLGHLVWAVRVSAGCPGRSGPRRSRCG